MDADVNPPPPPRLTAQIRGNPRKREEADEKTEKTAKFREFRLPPCLTSTPSKILRISRTLTALMCVCH